MKTSCQLRAACEECHERKIRCKQSKRRSGACEACSDNGRRCLFSLKSKTGRPKNTRSSSTPSTYLFTSQAIPQDCPRHPSNTDDTLQENQNLYFQIPIQTEFAVSQRVHEYPQELEISPSFAIRATTPDLATQDSLFEDENQASGFGNGPGGGFQGSEEMISPVSTSGDTMKEIHPFVNCFQSSLAVATSQHQQQNFQSRAFVGTRPLTASVHESEPLAPFGQETANCALGAAAIVNNYHVEDVAEFLRVLRISHELRSHWESLPRSRLSLLTLEDAEGVGVLLASLSSLCLKITNLLYLGGQDAPNMGSSISALVAAAVVDAIDQTVQRLCCLTDLEPAFQPDKSLDFLWASDFNMTMKPVGFNSDPLMQSETSTSSAASLSAAEINVDQLVALTRLDYFLLRIHTLVGILESPHEIIDATTHNTHPKQIKERLLSFHRCIEVILGGWRSGWER